MRALLAEQAQTPVGFMRDGRRTFWAYGGRFYWTDEELEPRDVAVLLHERELRAKRRLERAHAVAAQDEPGPAPRRGRIPPEIQQLVFERDGGRCVACGEAFPIQFDHIIPVSMGGATTPENLQLLCALQPGQGRVAGVVRRRAAGAARRARGRRSS